MTDEHTSQRDWVDLLLLAAIGVVWIFLLCGVLVMLREPCDTVMYVHFLWRRALFAVVLLLWVVLAGLRIWLRAKGDFTPRKRHQLRTLDCLLLLGVAALPVMLFCPPNDTGHDPLRPGTLVSRQYPAPDQTHAGVARAQLRYLLYLLAEYTERRRWPLVVFLHGGGPSETTCCSSARKASPTKSSGASIFLSSSLRRNAPVLAGKPERSLH